MHEICVRIQDSRIFLFEDVTQDQVKEWRTKAEQGNAGAQYNLGVCYDKGDGVPQDYAEAVKWFRKAAEQGMAEAQFVLGLCYTIGDLVPKNVTAYMWLNLSSAQGSDVAKEGKDRIAESMTKEQISEGQKLSREWLEKRKKVE